MARPLVSFLAWSPVPGRSSEIATALGGDSRCFHPRLKSRKLILFRYALNGARTVAYLVGKRPRAVIVTNPPIFPALIAYAYCLVVRAPLVLDSHPGSFGLKGDALGKAMLPVHRWLARRATATLVTTEGLSRQILSWGGRPLIVHEGPPMWEADAPRQPQGVLNVLFVTVFEVDEAVAEVFEAARQIEGMRLEVTGDPARCSQRLRDSLPGNVTLTGFLDGPSLAAAFSRADVVLALTTEPSSVLRAGYEAVYARRPLIVSDWPNLREVFPYAVYVSNDAASIAAGLEFARDHLEELNAAAHDALTTQEDRWSEQLGSIRAALRGKTTSILANPAAAARE